MHNYDSNAVSFLLAIVIPLIIVLASSKKNQETDKTADTSIGWWIVAVIICIAFCINGMHGVV